MVESVIKGHLTEAVGTDRSPLDVIFDELKEYDWRATEGSFWDNPRYVDITTKTEIDEQKKKSVGLAVYQVMRGDSQFTLRWFVADA